MHSLLNDISSQGRNIDFCSAKKIEFLRDIKVTNITKNKTQVNPINHVIWYLRE